MKSGILLKATTGLLLLSCLAHLTACKTTAVQSTTLLTVRPWPVPPAKPRMQSDVAEYLVKGKAAYLSCKATIDITNSTKKNPAD